MPRNPPCSKSDRSAKFICEEGLTRALTVWDKGRKRNMEN